MNNVIDMQVYRAKRDKKKLEAKIISAALDQNLPDTARAIKKNFLEWLQVR